MRPLLYQYIVQSVYAVWQHIFTTRFGFSILISLVQSIDRPVFYAIDVNSQCLILSNSIEFERLANTI